MSTSQYRAIGELQESLFRTQLLAWVMFAVAVAGASLAGVHEYRYQRMMHLLDEAASPAGQEVLRKAVQDGISQGLKRRAMKQPNQR